MSFKEDLIKKIKESPDIYNEIRVESLINSMDPFGDREVFEYIYDTQEDRTLETLGDEELIDSLLRNLKYYIEYEREMGESDI
ncbi:hypothetical protein [Halonatronum saccharophilum]|uniref:hypothetical protein n=1 Tax=Halonatronum saccharophilum TaxID=150060 RepID=UPI000487B0D3|nr:hypothetical protein [Halonatronum saccharophilum]